MPTINFTSNLKRFYPDLAPVQVEGKTVVAALAEVEKNYTGLRNYILDENGGVREHVNIFIGNDMIQDRQNLLDELSASDEVYIMQAISGG